MVDVDFRKWGDRPHWRFNATHLGSDEFGTWLGGLPPIAYTGPRASGTFDHAFVQLFPRTEWWVAVWNATGDVELYVDVSTPPQWPTSDHVTMIDLDLDVFRRRDGSVTLDDEDEFAEHQVLYGYPDDVVERALATACDLMDAVGEGRPPFGPLPEKWLDVLTAQAT